MRAALLPLLAACSFQHGLGGGPPDGDIAPPDRPGPGIDAPRDDAPPPDGPPPDGPPPSPLRQKTITIGTVSNGPHADFPLWVSLMDAEIAARALADGSDIHFVMGNMDLDYQIQRWDKPSGRLEAWVRVPSLNTGTQIAVRYGDASAAHPQNAANTFRGYQAVWHLDDPLTNNTVADARGMRNGTAQGLNASDSVAAQLGRGINFNDGNEQVTFTNPLSGNTPHTISLWVNQRTTQDNDAMVVLGNGSLNQARWFHSYFDADRIAVGFYSNDVVPPSNMNTSIVGDGWVLLHWVYEGPNRMSRIYRNGALIVGPSQHDDGTPNTQGNAGYLGNAPAAFGQNMGLHATLDEVRIINVTRSAGWIATEFANQSNPSTFYTVSAEQMP